jgi:hypothetical protein
MRAAGAGQDPVSGRTLELDQFAQARSKSAAEAAGWKAPDLHSRLYSTTGRIPGSAWPFRMRDMGVKHT